MNDKRILVIGYGAIGGAIIEEAGKAGIQNIKVAGRSKYEGLPSLTKGMFSKYDVHYTSGIDLHDKGSIKLLQGIMEDCDMVFHTAAGYPVEDYQIRPAVKAFKNVLSAAKAAGYSPESGKRLVLAGSPPARVHLETDVGICEWQEDYLVESPEELGMCGNTLYFKAEIRMAGLAESLAEDLAWVEFAPTHVISAWADHGPKIEVVPLYWKNKMPIAPGKVVDTIAGQDMGRAALQIAEKGDLGEVYQIGGVPFSIADMIIEGLRYAGATNLPKKHNLSDFNLKQIIRHGTLLKPVVDLARTTFLFWSAGSIDPIGRFGEEAYNPSYSALMYFMGKKRDMSSPRSTSSFYSVGFERGDQPIDLFIKLERYLVFVDQTQQTG